jgi:nitric oxide reductase subunit C
MTFDKRQARNMFAAGSALLAVALVLLTVSFHQNLDARTQAAQNLTEFAIKGKEVWERKNCINCHSRLGEGAYYAPDLTKVVTRRGDAWMRHFLKDPVTAYYGTAQNAAGRRKMPDLGLTDDEVEDLVSFFRFIEGIDTNGWPRRETLAVKGVALPEVGAVAEGHGYFKSLGCMQCHTANGSARQEKTGPDLTFAASRLTREWMVDEILNPTRDYPGTPMPSLGARMSPEIAGKLVAFLEYVNEHNGGAPRAPEPAAATATAAGTPATTVAARTSVR